MDEVMDVIEVLEAKKEEVQAMLRRELLSAIPDEETEGKIAQVTRGPEPGLGRYEEFKQYADQGRLVLIDDRLLMWLFPANIFQAFQEVWNLCYLFEGQTQKAYYDMHGLEYDYYSVTKDAHGVYQLVPYQMNRDAETIEALRPLIEIYEGKLNDIGDPTQELNGAPSNPFSKNWFRKRSKVIPFVRKNTYNYFRHIVHGKAKENLWTTFKSHRKGLSGDYYAKGWIPKNTRSTNEYRHKKNLAYLVNVFMKPEVQEYFRVKGIAVDEELYAFSELIQWVWRSRIRDGESINLYIPARRMRDLLKEWLESSKEKLQEVA